MELLSFKKDKGLTILTIGFLAWIVFLLCLGIFSSRDVYFFDVLSQTDVSADYTSIIPLARYLLEPIIGITLLLRSVVDGLLALLLIYAVARIGYILLQRFYLRKSRKFQLISAVTRKYTTKVIIVFVLLLVGIGSMLVIGFLSDGFLFINNYWMQAIQTYLLIGFVIIAALAILVVFKLVVPRFQFNYKRLTPSSSLFGKIFVRFGKELKNIICALGIIVMIGFLLIGTHFPTQKIETQLDPDEILIDFHVHTFMSDGFLSPEERVDWYIAQGIDAAFFTDHENQRGAYQARQYVEDNNLNFTVLIGQEYTCRTPDIHLNIFGLNQTIVPIEYETPGGPLALNVSDMIAYVKTSGAYVVVNHYHQNATAPYTYEQLRDWGVDGFEIVNDGTEYPTEIRTFCLANNLTCIAGSDIHTNQELHTITKLRLNDPNNLTIAHIFENMERNDHETVIIELYPEKISLPYISGVSDPFQKVLDYFLNLDIFQILSWVIWSTGSYLIFLFTYWTLKKADLNKLKEKVYSDETK